MTYRSETTSSVELHNMKRDEVTIYQDLSSGSTSVIFKGYLKAGGTILSSWIITIFKII